MSNHLNPDQDRCSVNPYLGLNYQHTTKVGGIKLSTPIIICHIVIKSHAGTQRGGGGGDRRSGHESFTYSTVSPTKKSISLTSPLVIERPNNSVSQCRNSSQRMP